jgi:hypothetical protein
MPIETTTGTAQTTESATSTDATANTTAAAATLLGGDAVQPQTTQQPPVIENPAAPPEPSTKEAPKPAEGAPEKYEFKAPEGKSYDANLLAAFEAGARDSNLTQDAAQKLLDSMAPKIQERQTEELVAIRKGWYEASQADKEFGGANLEQNLGIAATALKEFGSPELSRLLVSTGFSNHPEVIRAFVKIGQKLSSDKFVAGSPQSHPTVDATKILYDNTKKE